MSTRKMKDSGVAWLEKIPEGWQVYPLKYGFDFSKGLNITKADLTEKGVPVISYGQIHSKRNTGTHLSDELLRYVPCEFVQSDPAAVLQKNDFVFADTSEDLEGLGNCVFIDREDTVMAGYHAIVLRPSIDAEHKYLAYLFKTDCWRRQIRELAYGIKVYSLSQKILRRCSILLPPLPEQRRIAAYLDDRCARIDSVIETTKKTVEDYKALKQSIIFEAVTGKNAGGKMKDSGVPWIGEIPEGWKVVRLKFLFDTITDGSHFSPECTGEGLPYVTATDIRGVGIDFGTTKKIARSDYEKLVEAGCKICKDDILLVKDGATTGRVGLMDENADCVALSSVAMLRTKSNDCHFMMYLLMSELVQKQIRLSMAGAAMPRTTISKIVEYVGVLPPIHEQKSIADYLDKKCATIDSLIAEKLALIADLEAYKKSLVFECVTGKCEVA